MSITRMRENLSHVLRPIMWLLVAVFAVGAVMIIGMPAFQNKSQGGGAEDVVATVNGLKVTRAELMERYRLQEQMMGTNYSSPMQSSDTMVDILRQLMMEKLKLSLAQKDGVSAGYFEIGREKDKMINDQIDMLRQQAAAAISRKGKTKPTDAEIDNLLSRQSPPTTLANVRKEMDAKLTRDMVRDALLTRKMEDKVKAKAGNVTDDMVVAFYTEAKVRHIFMPAGQKPGPTEQNQAEKILAELKSGGDFAALAKRYSADPTSKDKGGELGWMPVKDDKDIQGLKKGELSKVLNSHGGYRIVQIEDIRTNLPKDYASNKGKYRDMVKQQMQDQAISNFYSEAQAKAKIDITDPELDGYWLAANAMQSFDPATRDKMANQAIRRLQQAVAKNDLPGPHAKLATMYALLKQNDRAISELNLVLNVKHSGEGADMRLLLGKLLVDKGDKEGAKKELDLAKDIGYADPNVHAALAQLYKQVGDTTQAAEQTKWLDDYQKRQSQLPGRVTPSLPGATKAKPAPGG